MSRKPRFASFGSSGQPQQSSDTEAMMPPQARPQGNSRKREASHKHLDQMWDDAEDEQIDGRQFWGVVTLAITFEDGVAQDIQASKVARDRVRGGRV